MGTPMEGFFGGAKFATLAASANTHGVPVKTSTSPTEPVPIDESTHTGEVSEVTHPLTETPSVQRGATPPATTQIETTSVTPLVISTDEPFHCSVSGYEGWFLPGSYSFLHPNFCHPWA